MEVLDKIQANINRFFKIVIKRQPGYDVCWVCGMPFEERNAEFCEVCHTYKCPYCGSCLCSLPESTRKVLDAEMYSVGLWDPPKRKRRRR